MFMLPVAAPWTPTTTALETAGTAGLDVAGGWSGLGLRGNASAPMTMEVEVPVGHRLGASGDGFGLMMSSVLPWFNLGNAAVSVGLARGALDAAVAHVRSARLEHLSVSLADLPTIRAYLAKAEVALRAAEALLAATARSMMAPDDGTMAAVLAIKAAGNETALEVTDIAMRVCGGAAFSHRLGIERRFRDARAGHVMAPTSDALYDFLGRLLCGIDLFA
jgi:alkylation response protein AidB-like acyl-CoA dehydrogenase